MKKLFQALIYKLLFLNGFLLLTGISTSTALAETAYISDELTVPIRSGHSTSHRIKRFLKSSTTTEVIEKSDDLKWTRIRLRNDEGWIRSEYLQYVPTAKLQLAKAEQELSILKITSRNQKKQLQELAAQLKVLQNQHQQLATTHEETENEYSKLKQLSANAVRIDKANSELIKENQLMKVDMEQLKAERDKFKTDNFNKGLQLGAGILIIGFLIGYVMKTRNSRRSSSW